MIRNGYTNAAAFLAAWILLLCLPGQIAPAQEAPDSYTDLREMPEGAYGERIRELLDATGTDDEAKVRAFIEKRFTEKFLKIAPIERHIAIFAQIHDQNRGFEFYSIRRYGTQSREGEFVVIVRDKLTRGWHGLVVSIETEPPHGIDMLRLSPARPPADAKDEEKLTEESLVRELREFVARLAKADVFSGAVLVARNGEILYQEACGQASKRFNAPNDMDTCFNLGSMNKMFTGVAVMQLKEKGKLSLDDPISRYVSEEWLPRDVSEKILVKHLLSHTSGLGSYFNEMFRKSSRLLFRNLEDYKPLVAGERPAFEPGTGWNYSNSGMLLLGVVIESASGEDYHDYVRNHIYEPAGMTRTGCFAMDRPVPNVAIGYSKERDGWHNNIFKHVVRGGPAGGGFSTAGDLLKFASALRGFKLLNEETTTALWTARKELHAPNYGFGFRVEGESGSIVGHSGGFSGISSNLDIFLESGFTAIVLSNYDRGALHVQARIRELIARVE